MTDTGRRRFGDARTRSGEVGVPLPSVWGGGAGRPTGPPPGAGPAGIGLDGHPVDTGVRLSGLTHDYPWLFEPQDARIYAAESTAQSANPAQTLTLLNFTNIMGGQQVIPARMAGKVTHFACDGADLANLVWTILIKGSPQPPINGIQWAWAPLTAPVAIPRPGIRLGPQDDVVVTVRNAGGAIITGIRARIHVVLWMIR